MDVIIEQYFDLNIITDNFDKILTGSGRRSSSR